MFKIDKIELLPRCRYKKNLESGIYEFGEMQTDNFYGDNISLGVIVGKNGSGKSSIIDMILRMANNLSTILFTDSPRTSSLDLKYILGIYANLYYRISPPEGNTIILCLCCRDRAMWLETNDTIYWLSDEKILGRSPNTTASFTECLDRDPERGKKIVFYDKLTPAGQQKIATLFFYTVATNYSMLAFLSPDYDREESIMYQLVRMKDSGGRPILDESEYPLREYKWMKSKNWINSLFHKNDGYMSPIVLNPYRNDAKFDMENESDLSAQRLSAMFICESEDMPLVPGYKLDGISYEFKDSFLYNFKLAKEGLSRGEILSEFVRYANDEGAYARRILQCLQCPVDRNLHPYLIALALYIVQKILNIAATYPLYIGKFGGIGGIDRTFMRFEKDSHYIAVGSLVRYVLAHHSHIELKVHQAIEFYNWAIQNPNAFSQLLENFNYKCYKQLRGLPDYGYADLRKCMATLPPSIFKQHIYLQKQSEDGSWHAEIPLWRMSSGERQLIYQLSTLLYHLHNLASVYPPNIHYSNINIILDEIEICYHPDYQRRFIKKLLDMLKGQDFNRRFNINILITTHSPFVLSDVKSSHILYLKDGHQLKGEELIDIRKPFAANVNDILKQSFFMDEGFVGSFAAEKINSLVSYLADEPQAIVWTDEEIEDLISNIGDPLVVFQLKKMIAKHKERHGISYREWLQSELRRLQ